MQKLRVNTMLMLALAGAMLFLAPVGRSVAQTNPGSVWTSSADIAEAQRILEYRGYLVHGYKSGTLDDPTSHAIRAFQSDHALPESGLLDGETYAQLLQHRPGKDSDGDGVPDNKDKCPNTPKGARVDANGCPKDTDGDGVVDGVDRCPDTPHGVNVDPEGCPLDSDRDGVFDGVDQCPDTPSGTRVDSKGCPQDSDGDGVADSADKCPNTPHGTKVGSDGCPADSDGDGVTDDKDRCPDTPRGTSVDAQGCPEKAAPPAALAPVIPESKKSLVLEGVNFDTNSAHLQSSSTAVLDRVAEGLKSHPEVRLEVQGHTDSQGNDAYNMKLSRDRANAVKDYLVGKGVPAKQLEAKGYGETKPIADNKTSGGRAVNRRVELKRLD
ncbi:MAG TPA: OmpA family protein [Candidatus Polarisedimenticolia bacterium]|nr:OmpA family protein [Candidatus Polarisedimenticolia bacterium]